MRGEKEDSISCVDQKALFQCLIHTLIQIQDIINSISGLASLGGLAVDLRLLHEGLPETGEVWLVNWNTARASEQAGMWPVLVIQNDIGNEKNPQQLSRQSSGPPGLSR